MASASLKLAYSIGEACEATSLGRSTIYNLIAAGRLRLRKVGRRSVILGEDLERLLEDA